MAYSPDGSRIGVAVATSTPPLPFPVSARLFLLEAMSGRVVWERTYPLGAAVNEPMVAFTPKGVLVTSAQNGETLLWDTKAGRVTRRFPTAGPFALSPDGHVAAVALNNNDPTDPNASLEVLDLRTGEHRFLADLAEPAWIVALQVTPDGTSVVGADFNGGLTVWDLASGRILQTFTGGVSVAVTPDGRTVLSEGVAWDLSGEQGLSRSFRWNDSDHGCPTVPCFVISPQGTLMASDQGDGTVALIDIRSRRMVGTLPATNGDQADAMAFFPDGRTLATGGISGTVTLWDVRTRSPQRTLRFSDPVWWVAVSPDGELMAVQTQAQNSQHSTVEVRKVDSGEVAFSKRVPYGKGMVFFSPDGRRLAALGCGGAACEGDSTIEVWDARSGADLFSPHVDGLTSSIAFSPDGRLLGAGTGDGKVVLFTARNGEPVGSPIQVAEGAILISFSPDGRLFVASSSDQTATLWDVESRKRIGNTFPVEPAVIPAAYFSSKGDVIIDYLAKATVWPTALRSWIGFACQVANRDLTRAEWHDVLGERPYHHVCPQ
jgi:WD40 repeat protein